MRARARVLVAGLLLIAAGCSSEREATPKEPTDGGGAAIGSCIEQYSPAALAKREFAFDGTVKATAQATTETGADSITFSVNRWYKGGSDKEVTLKATGLGGVTSAGSVSGNVGDRLLVAAEDDNLWLCGFTQPYTAAAAAEWSAALGG